MIGAFTVPFTIAAVFVPQVWLKFLLGILGLVCALSIPAAPRVEQHGWVARGLSGWPDH